MYRKSVRYNVPKGGVCARVTMALVSTRRLALEITVKLKAVVTRTLADLRTESLAILS